jgi:hypothetical protein
MLYCSSCFSRLHRSGAATSVVLCSCFSGRRKVDLVVYNLQLVLSRCIGVRVTYKRVLDWVVGFIDTLYTQFASTGNYSAIVVLNTL